jgi:hypothetical protein
MTPARTSDSGVSRNATDDLWRQTVMPIPTWYGRLAYLAWLRDPASGSYEHHGLALQYGNNDARLAMRRAHTRAFYHWLELDLDGQAADLDRHLAAPDNMPPAIAQPYMELEKWRNMVPGSVHGGDRKLFLAEARALIARLAYLAGSDPDRAA